MGEGSQIMIYKYVKSIFKKREQGLGIRVPGVGRVGLTEKRSLKGVSNVMVRRKYSWLSVSTGLPS